MQNIDKELTIRGIILGALITIIFTASNVYLGLKIGIALGSSIPAAVISIAVLKLFRNSTILENNMVQTQASSAGTLTTVVFVLPALLMMGYWQGFPFIQSFIICAAGGTLGVIFTIPLRQAMVLHSTLPYPEGVAAAEILRAGHHQGKGKSGIKELALGGIISATIGFFTQGLRLISDSAAIWVKGSLGIFQFPIGFSLALLGAGYLVGIVSAMALLLGLVLSWFIFVPYFGNEFAMADGANYIAHAMDIWRTKVRYIGVGIIGLGAVWTLIILIRPMLQGIRQSIASIKEHNGEIDRINMDLSPRSMLFIIVIALIFIVIALYSFALDAPMPTGYAIAAVILTTILSLVIGFLVAAASGYMAGLVGASSSPISGISIVSVVILSVALIAFAHALDLSADATKFLTALTIYAASIVMCSATISNDNLQDLKTGQLVGATPYKQQIALIIGCVVGALVIAPVLEILYNAYGFANAMPRAGMDEAQALSAPQANLMRYITDGIFYDNLEWRYIIIGIEVCFFVIVFDIIFKQITKGKWHIPPIAVGMGIYLPPHFVMPIVIGGIFSLIIKRHIRKYAEAHSSDPEHMIKKANRYSTLFAAGLIVGESLLGVVLAFIIASSVATGGSDAPLAISIDNYEGIAKIIGLAVFIATIIIFAQRTLKAKHEHD